MPELFLLAAVTLTFLFAGFIKGAIGVGLPTIVMGLLSIVMPPAQAAAMMVFPSIITNIWQMAAGPALAKLLRRFAVMILCMVAGTFSTVGLLAGPSTALATGSLGAVLAAYGLYGLLSARFRVPPRAERWLSPLVGLVTGALTGATGVFVVPVVPYYGALGLDKDELIQAIGITAFVCPAALGIALALHGRYDMALAGGSLLALLPALAGMVIGQKLRDRLHPAVFRRWFFGGLVALGGYMVLRAVVRASQHVCGAAPVFGMA